MFQVLANSSIVVEFHHSETLAEESQKHTFVEFSIGKASQLRKPIADAIENKIEH
jgi:hypothetical protein